MHAAISTVVIGSSSFVHGVGACMHALAGMNWGLGALAATFAKAIPMHTHSTVEPVWLCRTM
jgi:predicted ABC-type sugar transport system permease subunit